MDNEMTSKELTITMFVTILVVMKVKEKWNQFGKKTACLYFLLTKYVVQEPEGSSPHSQNSAIGP
jgi:hypothetical protein